MAVKASAQITLYRVIDIEFTTRYYLLQSSTLSTPSKPTTNPPSNLWTKTEPSYTEGSTKTLYFTDLTVFTNNTFKYSEVSKSSSYEAAKAAYNKAVAADKRVQAAETKITQNKNEIDLRAAAIEESLGDAEGRLTNAEASLQVTADGLESVAERLGEAESSLQITADGLSSVVERTDANETEISSLKQTASGLEIELTNTKTDIDDAKKVATNFLGFDSNGVVVGDRTKSTLGKNVLIDSDSVDIRDGSTVLATFAANQIELGKKAKTTIIKLCNGKGQITTQNVDNHESLVISSDSVNVKATDYMRVGVEPSSNYYYGLYMDATSKVTILESKNGNNDAWIQIDGNRYIDIEGRMASCHAALRIGSVLLLESSPEQTIKSVQYRCSGNSPSRDYSFVGYDHEYDYGGNAKYFNAVMTQNGEMAAAGGFKVNGIVDKFTNNVLWSGAYWPNGSQTCTLSNAISNQPHGIVLVFSNYSNSSAQNARFHCFFVPKQTVASYGGSGHQFNMFSTNFSQVCGKYLYISNTSIRGHDDNTRSGTGSSGIKYANNTFVLRTVIGV